MYVYETPFGTYEDVNEALARCKNADFGPECVAIREVEEKTVRFLGKDMEEYVYL